MLDHDVWQWRATAYCRKWISNKKVLNGCISTLWDDVRLDLDEYVIPRVCPLSVFQTGEKGQSTAHAVSEIKSGCITRLRFPGIQCLPEDWRSHYSARFQTEISACFSSCRSHSMTAS